MHEAKFGNIMIDAINLIWLQAFYATLFDLQTPALQTEIESIFTFKKFVEQEQLIEIYEDLIPKWLDETRCNWS